MNAVVQSVTVVHTLYAVCTRGRKEGSEKKGSAKKKKKLVISRLRRDFLIDFPFFPPSIFTSVE